MTLKWKIYFYKKCRKLVNEIRERKIQMNCASPFTNCSSRGEVVDSNCDVLDIGGGKYFKTVFIALRSVDTRGSKLNSCVLHILTQKQMSV